MPCRLGLTLMLAAAAQVCAAQTATLPDVEVVGSGPIPGQLIDRNVLPYQTQTIRRERIDQTLPDNLLDLMSRQMAGVQVNDIQGSPFQGEFSYRGFRASSLLGAGQGLSVYLDGVRINEPFGDVVNFDLLPEYSVASLSLVPGANPAFGLNSLGGALSYTTFDGRSAPGARAELSAGSFGRARLDLSVGRVFDSGWHAYLGGSAFREDGWRDFSEGRLGNVLAKVGHDDGSTAWTLGLLLARSTLIGNGLAPAFTINLDNGQAERRPDLYAYRRESIYTHTDETVNRVTQLAFNATHALDAQSTLAGLLYLRRGRRSTTTGDEAGEPTPEVNAALNTAETRQTGWGGGASLARQTGPHQWQLGASVDGSSTSFEQFEQEASFSADRGAVAIAGEPVELSAKVDGRSLAFGLYGTDTWQLAAGTWLTGTLRWNQARVSNELASVDDDTDVYTQRGSERFSYRSLNPALGVAHRLGTAGDRGAPTLFANFARNNRVPTVIELGCADPEQPCRLPAGLQSDPFLDQVISRTAEAGVRWQPPGGWRMSLEAYRTENRNDILFRSTSLTGQLGYFANFPKTRHQGADLELGYRLGAVDLSVGASLLDATYQADGVLRQGERNVAITPGTRIAGLPRWMLKLSGDWRGAFSMPALSLGADLQAYSSRPSTGNEDGLAEDGSDIPVDLSVAGYALLNLRAIWRPEGKAWEVFARVNNATDRHVQSYGALGETVFDAQGGYTGIGRNALFVGPGAPRSFFAGVRLRY